MNARDVLPYAMTIVAASGVLASVQVLGFTHHRLRLYNWWAIISIVLVALSGIRTIVFVGVSDWVSVVCWANLATCMLVGNLGMLRLMFADRKPTP